jgi:hypothetical protein
VIGLRLTSVYWAALPVLVAALAIAFLTSGDPSLVVNADSLLPAEFVWDVAHHATAWRDFQQARVPSLVPDLLVLAPVQLITGSWRVAVAVWVVGFQVLLVGGGAAAVASLARVGRGAAAWSFATVIVLIYAAAFSSFGRPSPALMPYLQMLQPFVHGGPLALGMIVAVMAREAVRAGQPARPVTLALLTFAAAMSDVLVVAYVVVPMAVALAGAVAVGSVPRTEAKRVLTALGIGAVLGAAVYRLLPRQPLPIDEARHVLPHLVQFIAALPNMGGLLVALAILALALGMRLRGIGARNTVAEVWPVFILISVLAALCVTIAMFYDVAGQRYAFPIWFWAPVVCAGVVARTLAARPAWGGAAFGSACVLLLAQTPAQPLALLRWTTPLVACLDRASLSVGLADYWHARATAAATDWRVQIQPISDTGEARIWGNDRDWFAYDIHDAARRPAYRFIVIDGLDPDGIRRAYGAPDGVHACDGTTVWTYDDPERLYRDLAAASPGLARVFAAAPPR